MFDVRRPECFLFRFTFAKSWDIRSSWVYVFCCLFIHGSFPCPSVMFPSVIFRTWLFGPGDSILIPCCVVLGGLSWDLQYSPCVSVYPMWGMWMLDISSCGKVVIPYSLLILSSLFIMSLSCGCPTVWLPLSIEMFPERTSLLGWSSKNFSIVGYTWLGSLVAHVLVRELIR